MAIVSYVENMMPSYKENETNKKEISHDFVPKVVVHQENLFEMNKVDPQRTTFQKAMKVCVFIGQFFGLNPVLGIFENDISKLRFTPYSFRSLYTFISLMLQSCACFLCFLILYQGDDHAVSNSGNLVFYATNTMSTILFFRVAMKWPKLCQQIAKFEAADPTVDPNLVKRCNFYCILVLSLAFVEHFLSDACGILTAMDCMPDMNLYEAYSYQTFAFIWSVFYYHHILAIIATFVNIQLAFTWNFTDAFVICISLYLTTRLQQVNDRIVAVRGKDMSVKFWRAMREDYCKITSLVKKVDDVINGVILISFANNLFFICLQLLHLLEDGVKPRSACDKSLDTRPLKGFEYAVYFTFSFGFLLGRSIAVSLIAARVHTASKIPANSLYDVPSVSYCIEVQRFLDQVHGDIVALSGLQFFNVKRGLVLTVAGTIVTYELVMIQFAGVSPTTAPPTLFLPPETTNESP